MNYSPLVLAAVATMSLAPWAAAPAAARAKPAAEVMFRDAGPEAVAPRLASECTRRRMALIRNTPERVVCKRPVAARQRGPHGVNELWSFVLDRVSHDRTKVEAHASYEATAPHGYAVLSFSDVSPESRTAMRGFMENVRDGAMPVAFSR